MNTMFVEKREKKMFKLSDSCRDKCSDSCGKMLFATAKNTTDVLQVVNSTSLLQLVEMKLLISLSCNN